MIITLGHLYVCKREQTCDNSFPSTNITASKIHFLIFFIPYTHLKCVIFSFSFNILGKSHWHIYSLKLKAQFDDYFLAPFIFNSCHYPTFKLLRYHQLKFRTCQLPTAPHTPFPTNHSFYPFSTAPWLASFLSQTKHGLVVIWRLTFETIAWHVPSLLKYKLCSAICEMVSKGSLIFVLPLVGAFDM